MHSDPHLLGQRVAHLRRAHGLSQRRLAEAAGVSHGYIALLELGRLASPGTFRLDAIARALGLRTSESLRNAHDARPSANAASVDGEASAQPGRAEAPAANVA